MLARRIETVSKLFQNCFKIVSKLFQQAYKLAGKKDLKNEIYSLELPVWNFLMLAASGGGPGVLAARAVATGAGRCREVDGARIRKSGKKALTIEACPSFCIGKASAKS